jgi:hypothetical protein
MVLASDIAAYSQTIFNEAWMIARDNMIARALVTNYTDRSGTAARSSSTYGTATFNSITETDDLTSQAFTPSTLATLTPGEVGAQFFISDSRRETDPFEVQSDATMELGMAYAEKVDTNIFSNFSSLTGGTVGASGTVITWGHYNAMLARLVAQKAPAPYYFVLHPYQWAQLGKAASVASSARTNADESLLAQIASRWVPGMYFGVNVLLSTNVPLSSTDAYCAMFAKPALAFDERRPYTLELERDASRRGWEFNAHSLYGHGVWRPKFGIQGIFDNTAPSS